VGKIPKPELGESPGTLFLFGALALTKSFSFSSVAEVFRRNGDE